jgi:hypothetical protein
LAEAAAVRGMHTLTIIMDMMIATSTGTVRMTAASKRLVPSFRPLGNKHMLMGLLKSMMSKNVATLNNA